MHLVKPQQIVFAVSTVIIHVKNFPEIVQPPEGVQHQQRPHAFRASAAVGAFAGADVEIAAGIVKTGDMGGLFQSGIGAAFGIYFQSAGTETPERKQFVMRTVLIGMVVQSEKVEIITA